MIDFNIIICKEIISFLKGSYQLANAYCKHLCRLGMNISLCWGILQKGDDFNWQNLFVKLKFNDKTLFYIIAVKEIYWNEEDKIIVKDEPYLYV